ncbi:MAG: C40 family peptidase [Bacteroidota bacterium]
MEYGLGHLSIVPIRLSPDEDAGMISQIIYGDHFKIKESRKTWSRIRITYDGCEGWVQNNQITRISETSFRKIEQQDPIYSTDFITHVCTGDNVFLPVLLGSRMDIAPILQHTMEEAMPIAIKSSKNNLVTTALLYLNCPYLKGGKSPFGIDSSGFTQMVYKINGYRLLRTTEQQATQGEPLSFIEESEAGDMVFFDNSEGSIDHVGIILENNYVIHCFGSVRIDRIDHTGIFDVRKRRYTHQLRVIKKVI